MNEFAELVRRERERQGIRAYDLARSIGVAPSWVSRLESGEMSNPPTPEHMSGIARCLHIAEPVLLSALGYRIAGDAPVYDADAETIARAVRGWTPAQKQLLWDYVRIVSAALDRIDPPDRDDSGNVRKEG